MLSRNFHGASQKDGSLGRKRILQVEEKISLL